MSETKVAFAERTIRPLKSILYRYMENRETSIFTNCLSAAHLRIPEKNARYACFRNCQEFRPSVHSVQQATAGK